jgi:hypothetical protein
MNTVGRPTNDAMRRKLIARRYAAALERKKVANGFKALARIRRDMQLLRANRAVAKEREVAA